MRKINVVMLWLVSGVMCVCFLQTSNLKADDAPDQGTENVAIPQDDNQAVNDEGYGNTDAEYYNSEDDVVNEEEPSGLVENTSQNDAQ